MRTAKNIAEMALDYCDVAGAEDILAAATARQKQHLCSVISGALQELHSKNPGAFVVPVGKVLPAPVGGSAIFTAGSTTVDASSWGSVDLRGRMFQSGGVWNQFAAATGAPGNQIVTPWTGSSGTQAITVYGDSFLVGSNGFSVVGNVHLQDYGLLRPCPDRATYLAFRDDLFLDDYGARGGSRINRRIAGQPESWWVEGYWREGSSQQLYMHLAPLPEREFTITYDLSLKPRTLTVDDLEDDDLVIPVLADYYDAVLIPWVLQRWTGSPWFRNAEAQAEIARQFQVARNIVVDWSPQQETGTRLIVATY